MIERCPACGAGPVTTNLQGLAEDAVTIVLRAEKASDLAAAIKKFHPDFEEAKASEVLAFAREHLSSGAAFQVSSVFAETCVAAVRMTCPNVKVEVEASPGGRPTSR
jgi:hypothetical protein